jgi:hypothetical protein
MADTPGVGFNLFGTAEYWRYIEIHCPNCGACSVWQTEDVSVANDQRANMCLECNCCFYISALQVATDWGSVLRRKAIRKGNGVPTSGPFLVLKHAAQD